METVFFERRFVPKNNLLGVNDAILLDVEGIAIWVSNNNGTTEVFYDECAHKGSALAFNGKNFVCPQHGWEYNLRGENLNTFSSSLRKVRILSETDDFLELLLPLKSSNTPRSSLTNNLEVAIHSHASIQVTYREKSVLFDPWLEGTAFYGSWHLHPRSKLDVRDVEVNAIVITHPHPDHFHLQTLQSIDRDTPIYFPKFRSKIIENGLSELGFRNQNPLFWDDTVCVEEFFNLRFLRPRSMWEDAGVLTQIVDDGVLFSWLNLADAGSVIDEFALPDIDLLTSTFGQGASGYPLTWDHIHVDKKIQIIEARKSNNLALLATRASKMRASFFLPFASHWRLGLAEHEEFAKMIPHTTFEELEQSFRVDAPGVKFLAIYPGESYNFFNHTLKINPDSRNELSEKFVPDRVTFESFKSGFDIDAFRLKFAAEMSRLVSKSEAFGVENVMFCVFATDFEFEERFEFITAQNIFQSQIQISVKVPMRILSLFAAGKANWDHISIGYWGEWSSNPKVYPSNFMRLLQSGRENFPKNVEPCPKDLIELTEMSIGELIEANPISVPIILNRLGLPCLSCVRSNAESLGQALEIHNVDKKSNYWLLKELDSATG